MSKPLSKKLKEFKSSDKYKSFLQNIKKNTSYEKVGALYGFTREQVSALAIDAGIRRKISLTKEEEFDLYKRYEAGETKASLMADYGISDSYFKTLLSVVKFRISKSEGKVVVGVPETSGRPIDRIISLLEELIVVLKEIK